MSKQSKMARIYGAKNKAGSRTGEQRKRCNVCGKRKYISLLKVIPGRVYWQTSKYRCITNCINSLGNAEEQPSQAGETTQMR